MSYSNYRYDENDRELEEISERLPENFDDFMKRHKQETIQLYQNEFNSTLRLLKNLLRGGILLRQTYISKKLDTQEIL
jgi:hypothetical protein